MNDERYKDAGGCGLGCALVVACVLIVATAVFGIIYLFT